MCVAIPRLGWASLFFAQFRQNSLWYLKSKLYLRSQLTFSTEMVAQKNRIWGSVIDSSRKNVEFRVFFLANFYFNRCSCLMEKSFFRVAVLEQNISGPLSYSFHLVRHNEFCLNSVKYRQAQNSAWIFESNCGQCLIHMVNVIKNEWLPLLKPSLSKKFVLYSGHGQC